MSEAEIENLKRLAFSGEDESIALARQVAKGQQFEFPEEWEKEIKEKKLARMVEGLMRDAIEIFFGCA